VQFFIDRLFVSFEINIRQFRIFPSNPPDFSMEIPLNYAAISGQRIPGPNRYVLKLILSVPTYFKRYYLLERIIMDEEHHLKLFREASAKYCPGIG
jgi:hypothetical protein